MVHEGSVQGAYARGYIDPCVPKMTRGSDERLSTNVAFTALGNFHIDIT